jgi:hypothetical protein
MLLQGKKNICRMLITVSKQSLLTASFLHTLFILMNEFGWMLLQIRDFYFLSFAQFQFSTSLSQVVQYVSSSISMPNHDLEIKNIIHRDFIRCCCCCCCFTTDGLLQLFAIVECSTHTMITIRRFQGDRDH